MANWRAFRDANGNEIYLNLDLAARIVADGKGHTLIGFAQTQGFNDVAVQEAPGLVFERTAPMPTEAPSDRSGD